VQEQGQQVGKAEDAFFQQRALLSSGLGAGLTLPIYPVSSQFANRLDGLFSWPLNDFKLGAWSRQAILHPEETDGLVKEATLFDPDIFIRRCPDRLRSRIELARPLSAMTTLRVGGPAALVCTIQTPEEARRFQDICHEMAAPAYFLGAGSNILAADEGFPGVILHVAAKDLEIQRDSVTVGAGLAFDSLIERTLAAGVTGLEFASGIPGTLGGALVGNAGCYGHEIGEFLAEAVVLRRDGTLETVGPEAFGFRYRATSLRETGDLVLQATLRLHRQDVHRAAEVRAEKLADRKAKHPVDVPSAGSWFRNLPPAPGESRRRPAGLFLEQAGAKEMSVGDARVFPGHANIIINGGSARASDVRELVRRMQAAVKEKFDLDLVEEVRYLSPTSDFTS
jgi:UDP-N-acetylmuramate dehydrogenase